jgi:hypothetical protein
MITEKRDYKPVFQDSACYRAVRQKGRGNCGKTSYKICLTRIHV